jgi:hypothetical protein
MLSANGGERIYTLCSNFRRAKNSLDPRQILNEAEQMILCYRGHGQFVHSAQALHESRTFDACYASLARRYRDVQFADGPLFEHLASKWTTFLLQLKEFKWQNPQTKTRLLAKPRMEVRSKRAQNRRENELNSQFLF